MYVCVHVCVCFPLQKSESGKSRTVFWDIKFSHKTGDYEVLHEHQTKNKEWYGLVFRVHVMMDVEVQDRQEKGFWKVFAHKQVL